MKSVEESTQKMLWSDTDRDWVCVVSVVGLIGLLRRLMLAMLGFGRCAVPTRPGPVLLVYDIKMLKFWWGDVVEFGAYHLHCDN